MKWQPKGLGATSKSCRIFGLTLGKMALNEINQVKAGSSDSARGSSGQALSLLAGPVYDGASGEADDLEIKPKRCTITIFDVKADPRVIVDLIAA